MMSILKLEVKQLQSNNHISQTKTKNELIKHLQKATHSTEEKKINRKTWKEVGGKKQYVQNKDDKYKEHQLTCEMLPTF